MRRYHWVAVASALLLLAVATVSALFGGPFSTRLQEPLETIVIILPSDAEQLLPAAVLGAAGLLYFYDRTDDASGGLVDPEMRPEQPRNAPEIVGATFQQSVEDAVTDIRLERSEYTETEPYQKLRDAVQRGLQSKQGYTAEEATAAIDAGTWTDDPVARAFLSPSVEFPVQYQFLWWAQPEQAYERALEQTSDVVLAFVRRDTHQPSRTDSHPWTERLRSLLGRDGDDVAGQPTESESADGDSAAGEGFETDDQPRETTVSD